MTRLNVLIGPLIIAAGISLGDVEFIGPAMVMPQASAVTGQREIAITSGRLLCEIAMILEDRFHKPVTYEDAILSWKGDVAFTTKARGLYPKERTLRLPADIICPRISKGK